MQLTHSTAANFPNSMSVGDIELDAPPETLNTLLLNNVGVSTPLTAASVTMTSNTVITMLSSALNSAGTLNVSGTFNQGNFSGVTVSNLYIGGNAVYNLSNGTLNVIEGQELLGGSGAASIFNQEGGFHYASQLSILAAGTFNLRGGQLGGNVQVAGGMLYQTGGDFCQNDLFVTGTYLLNGGTVEATNQIGIQYGAVVQNGGTNTSGLLRIVTSNTSIESPIAGSYVLSNGVLHVSGMNIGFWGVYEQDGGVSTIDGSIAVPTYFSGPRPGFEVAGDIYIHGGILSVGSIGTAGRISQTGGTNEVRGDLVFGDWSPAEYDLSGGLLTTSNTILIQSVGQGFFQTGGRHVVAHQLQLGASYPHYTMSDGELVAPDIEMTGSWFDHTAGDVSNATVLALNSSTWREGTTAQTFGQLQLSGVSNSASALALPSGTACVVRFADSSGRGWSNGVVLQIQNWDGSLTGGGMHQVIFGNSAAALTTPQLQEIVFNYSGTQYPAKILATGEIVPDLAANSPPLLSLQTQTNGAMRLILVGITGRDYEVQVSTDLWHWSTWTQLNSTGTNFVDDTGTSGIPRRFYRVQLLP